MGVAAGIAERGGEVDRPGAAQHADGQVAQGRHDLRGGPGPDLGGVLGEGDIPHVVQAVLDSPVPAQQIGEPGGAGLGVDGCGVPPVGAQVAGLAGDLEDLSGVREANPQTVTALRVRISTRPCAWSRVRSSMGT